jgi:outer membrane biosynthesis protein TonB
MSHGTRSAKHGAKVKVFAMAAVLLAAVLCVFTLIGPARAEEAGDIAETPVVAVAEEPAGEPASEPTDAAAVDASVPELKDDATTEDEAAVETQETAPDETPTAGSVQTPAVRTAAPARVSVLDEMDQYTATYAYPKVKIMFSAPNAKVKTTFRLVFSFVSGPTQLGDTGANRIIEMTKNDSGKSFTTVNSLKFSLPGTYTYKYYELVEGAPDGATTYRDENGFEYDLAVRYIAYTVTADDEGRLTAVASDTVDADGNPIDPVLSNRKATIAESSVSVQPVIQGRDWEAGDSATVTLTPTIGTGSWNGVVISPDNVVLGQTELVADDGAENHTVTTTVSMKDYQEGTMYLAVSESDVPAGTVLDRNGYVRIDWKFDDNGVLTGTVRYGDSPYQGAFVPAEPFQLVNKTTTTPEIVDVEVTKELVGRPWTDEDAFTFNIERYTPPVDASAGNNTSIVSQLLPNNGNSQVDRGTSVSDTAAAPVETGSAVEVDKGFTGQGHVGYVEPVCEETTEVTVTNATADKTAAFHLAFNSYEERTYVITEMAGDEEGMTYADSVYVKVVWNDDYSYMVYYSTDPELTEDSWTTDTAVFTNVFENPFEAEVAEPEPEPAPEPEPEPEPVPTPEPEVEVVKETDKATEDKPKTEPEAEPKPAAKPAAAKTVVKTSATPKTGDFAMFGEFAAAGAALVGAAAALARKRK